MRKIAFFLSAVALVASIVFCAGCNNNNNNSNEDPSQLTDKLLSCIQAGDMNSYYKFSGTSAQELESSNLSGYLLNDKISSYEIVNQVLDETGSSAEVLVKVQTSGSGLVFLPLKFIKQDKAWKLTY